MADDWRWAAPNGRQRRLSLEKLRTAIVRGELPTNVRVWRRGWREWRPADAVIELSTDAPPDEEPAPRPEGETSDVPPPPMAMLEVQKEYEASGPLSGASIPEAPPAPPTFEPKGGDARHWSDEPGAEAPEPLGTVVVEAAPAPVALPNRLATAMGLSPAGAPSPSFPDRVTVKPPAPRLTLPDADVHTHGTMRSLIAQVVARSPRNKFLRPVLLVTAAVALLGGLSLCFTGSSSSTTNKTAPSATASAGDTAEPSAQPSSAPTIASTTGTTAPAHGPATSTATVASAAPSSGCQRSETTHVLTPYASVASGLEIVPNDKSLLVGFAASAQDAMGVMLDRDFAATQVERQHAPERIRHVVPALVNANLVLSIDTDHRGSRLTSRRTASDLSADFGVAEGSFVTTPHGKDTPTKLFKLEGDAPVESLRILALGERRGYAFAFRQNSTLVFGDTQPDVPNATHMHRLDTGKFLGAPALAVSQATVGVVWAERAAEDDPWVLSTATWQIGKRDHTVTDFVTPPGGLGQRSISPALAGNRGGFLLSWTEGPPKGSQVRGQLLDAAMHARGEPFTLSEPLRNAGQSQVVLHDDGRGAAIFFVESKPGAFALSGLSVTCSPE